MAEKLDKHNIRGSELIDKVRKYGRGGLGNYNITDMLDLVSDFNMWKHAITESLKENNFDKTDVAAFESSENFLVNPAGWAFKACDKESSAESFRLYIDNVDRLIKELRVLTTRQEIKLTSRNVVEEDSNKIKITISDRGIFRTKDDKFLIYKSKVASKRRKLIYCLRDNIAPMKLNELMAEIGYINKETLSKEAGQINKVFVKKLKFVDSKENFLIVNYQTGDGYTLNREKYFFE